MQAHYIKVKLKKTIHFIDAKIKNDKSSLLLVKYRFINKFGKKKVKKIQAERNRLEVTINVTDTNVNRNKTRKWLKKRNEIRFLSNEKFIFFMLKIHLKMDAIENRHIIYMEKKKVRIQNKIYVLHSLFNRLVFFS